MFKTIYNQNGFLDILILFALLVAGIVLLAQPPAGQAPDTTQSNTEDSCVITSPDPSQSITYNGTTYNLIKQNVAVMNPFVNAPQGKSPHYELQPQEYNNEKVYTSPFILADNVPDSSIDASDLIYVDVTDEVNLPQINVRYLNIYLAAGEPMPPAITQFCSLDTPTEPYSVWQGNITDSLPPLRFNSSEISAFNIQPSTNYYLVAYDNLSNPNWQYTFENSSDNWPISQWSPIDGSATYQAIYIPASNMEDIILTDKNPNDPDSNDFFVYSPSSVILGNPVDPTQQQLLSNLDSQLNLLSTDNKTSGQGLQIQTQTPWSVPPWGWWNPECKPAIYLYPPQKTNVNVKISPNGFLTHTDPLYPQGSGWNVVANPDGSILDNGKTYPYLYYESKINDSAIQKPTTGYVVKYNKLANLFSSLLPQLGLNQKETADFSTYWLKALPKRNYYFVGVLSRSNIDYIEPLTITPQPSAILRVRLYFKGLDNYQSIQEPTIQPVTPRQSGVFNVVEWGGLVKNDLNHPFTCSQ